MTDIAPSPSGLHTQRDPKVIIGKIVGIVVLLGVLYYLPQQLERSQVTTLTGAICIALAALGLNLLTGYNGQISVGHGAFFGLGAYTVAILQTEYAMPHWQPIVYAAILAFILGVIVGLPALRITGVYLALVTLALATLFPAVIDRFPEITGGSQGLQLEGTMRLRPPQAIRDQGIQPDQWMYYVALVIAVVSFVLVRNLVRSRVGRALVAIRDNETPAEVLGVNVGVYKVITFGVSAMFAGIGGALFCYANNGISSGQVGIQLSIQILVVVVVGGVATYFGPALGAVLFVFVEEYFRQNAPEVAPVLFGASLILLMMVAPGGILGLAKQGWAKVKPKPKAPASPAGPGPASAPAQA